MKQGLVVWNSIMKAKAMLRDGFEFFLGNDSSSLWYASWSSFGKQSNQVWYVDIHDIHKTIADIVQNGKCDFSQLYTQLPANVL